MMMGSMKGTAISRPKRMIQFISTHIRDGWLVCWTFFFNSKSGVVKFPKLSLLNQRINNQSDFMKIIVFLVD